MRLLGFKSAAVFGAILLATSASAQSPWDTTTVDDKVLIRFNAIVAGLTIDEASSQDKLYLRTLWDSLVREEQGDKVFLTPSDVFACGTSSVTYYGHSYSTVEINSMCWFAENLRTSKYTNGDDIATGLDNSTWATTTSGAVTVYDEGGANEASNLSQRGRLYNNYAAADARGICPSGWHVPSRDEFTALRTFLGAEDGKKMKSSVNDVPDWDGTNESGFSAFPAGYRNTGGIFAQEDRTAFWTTSTWDVVLQPGNDAAQEFQPGVNYGLSVRCLKDSEDN